MTATIHELAAAAVEELNGGEIGEAVRDFADELNRIVSQGMPKIDISLWRGIAIRVGEDHAKEANDIWVYWWLRGVSGEASLLLACLQHQIDRPTLVQNVSKLSETVASMITA